MSNAPIVFDGVSKKFLRGERHDSLRDLVPALARKLRGVAARKPSDDFWALRDVSFSVRQGGALGIIGPNGAGKSTTLKLLTRILRPTSGSCRVRGRIGALIEVAAGFHPDLTGRENIFLQGAIMGMKRHEIARKLDAIVDFAGVSGFIDTPVKRYSTGMNARLGFSVAAHLDPEVLIIDEVLAVGDMSFQERCINRMMEFRKEGVTIVFVSHNLQAVSTLCPESLFLHGSTRAYGPTDDVIREYIRQSADARAHAGKSDIQISSEGLRSASGPVTTISPGERVILPITYTPGIAVDDVDLGFNLFRSTDGLLVHAQGIPSERVGLQRMNAGEPASVQFAFNAHLTRGHYHIECHVFHRPTQCFLGELNPAAVFQVEERNVWGGVADIELSARSVSPASALAGASPRDHAVANANETERNDGHIPPVDVFAPGLARG
jgi:ABC-type polysaccharide/polyol phosphate transport system ATPase subunit